MEQAPYFSVVTCTWNSATYLPECIESLLQQDFHDFELVFVDAGSDDGTLAYIDAIPWPRKTVLNGVRGGISKAMNAGIEAARGQVVMHLHSDDYLAHPRVLSRVAQVMARGQGRWLYGRTLTRINASISPETPDFPDFSYGRLLSGNIVPHPATFVERALYQETGGFDETLKYAMDYDMWLRIARDWPPVQLREFLSVFRKHGGSTTYANRLASFDEDYRVRCRYTAGMPLTRLSNALRYWMRRRQLEPSMAAP